MTEVAPRAVITPVEPEVPPVTVAPTSIVAMSDSVKVALTNTAAVFNEELLPWMADTGIVQLLPCIAATEVCASSLPPTILITSEFA